MTALISTMPVTIKAEGPVLTRATAIGGMGVDAPIARLDDEDRTPYLAGSHVLGKVRHALQRLLEIQKRAGGSGPIPDACIEDWFGGQGDEGEGYAKRRRIFFSDFTSANPGNPAATRTRIAIDRERGAAKQGALLTLETPYRSGEPVEFSGSVHAIGPDGERETMARTLRLGLQWLSQIGGLRTIGFGRVLDTGIGSANPPSQTTPTRAVAERLTFVLQFHDPLCVAETRNSGNTFVTSDTVAGGIIKGAIANLIAAGEGRSAGTDLACSTLFPALGKHFSALRFSHLFPAPHDNAVRPSRWPSSLVVDNNDAFHDVALWEEPKLVNGRAPAFYHDWKPKHFATANACARWPCVERSLRVRTAIDFEETRAKHEALFAYEMLNIHKHVWVGEIGLEDIDEVHRPAVITELSAALANGFPGIGRSQSFATVAPGSWQPSIKAAAPAGKIFVFTLQTAALLRGSENTYDDSIKEISGGTLHLLRHFVSERLSGASFLANRYYKHKPYRPWILTEPGSVFVVEPTGTGDPLAVIKFLGRKGLPLPENVRSFYELGHAPDAELWSNCPYIRPNGYGEVAISGFSKG
jgi:hypothetical protein